MSASSCSDDGRLFRALGPVHENKTFSKLQTRTLFAIRHVLPVLWMTSCSKWLIRGSTSGEVRCQILTACPVHCKKTKKVHETTTILLVTLPAIHRYHKKITDRFSNKPFLIWLLTTAPYLKYVATLPCNLSLIACFLTLMFHKVVRQHMQGVVEFLVTIML